MLPGSYLIFMEIGFHKCYITDVEQRKRSGRKKEPKPKLFGPDIFQWGRGLPRERVGAKKFDTSLETREIKLFGRDIPGLCRDIPPKRPKSLRKKGLQKGI